MSASVPPSAGCQADGSVRQTIAEIEIVRFRPSGPAGRLARGANAPPSSFLLLYSLARGEVTCGTDEPLVLAPGHCSVVHGGTVAASGAGIDLIAVSIPDSSVSVYHRTLQTAAGRVFPTEQGTASLVASLLTGLADQLGRYAPSNPSRLAHHLLGLIALMCSDSSADETGSAKRALLERSKDYIESHLADVNLTPDQIADSLHVSSRTLHRVFEAEGVTIGTWIRNRRLEHCRLDLADSTLREVPVSHIASSWGLWDASHFSRLFKACFGLSPRAYRLAQRDAAVAPVTLRPALRRTA